MRRLILITAVGWSFGTLALAGETSTTLSASLLGTSATLLQPPPSVPGIYTIRPDGYAILHGWDDAATTVTPQPRVLSRIPLEVLGGEAVRGNGFYIQNIPNVSQPIDLPKAPASLRFLITAYVAHHELPRFQVWLKDAEGGGEPILIYDGFIQSLGKWRVVAPIPERFRGKFGIVELRVPNASRTEYERTVFVNPVEIIEGTAQKSGSGLMD